MTPLRTENVTVTVTMREAFELIERYGLTEGQTSVDRVAGQPNHICLQYGVGHCLLTIKLWADGQNPGVELTVS